MGWRGRTMDASAISFTANTSTPIARAVLVSQLNNKNVLLQLGCFNVAKDLRAVAARKRPRAGSVRPKEADWPKRISCVYDPNAPLRLTLCGGDEGWGLLWRNAGK